MRHDEWLGWATGRLIDHDALAPGVIRRLLNSGPERRQSVFALLAIEISSQRHGPTTAEAHVAPSAVPRAQVVRDGSARDVLTEALGRQPPNGLRGALERVGPLPLREPRLYRRLVEVYSTREHGVAAKALRYAGQITDTMLDVLEVLPVGLIHPSVLRRLDSMNDARSFLEAVQFAKFANTQATDAALREALTHSGERTSLEDVLARFVRRADRQLGAPLDADDEVRPLRQVRDMILAARRFRNCLSTESKIVGALLGHYAYAVFADQVVMEFVQLTTGAWLFLDAHAARNGPVTGELLAAARAKCVSHGVATLPRGSRRAARFSCFEDPHYSCLVSLDA